MQRPQSSDKMYNPIKLSQYVSSPVKKTPTPKQF